MSERRLIASLLQSRPAFDRIDSHLDVEDLSEQGRIVIEGLREYYSRDSSAKLAEPDLLARDVGRTMTNPKHREAFEELISALAEVETSPENVVHDYISVKRDAVGNKLSVALAGGQSGDDVRKLIAEYEDWCNTEELNDEEESDAIMVGADVTSLVTESFNRANLIRIMPESLNRQLDGGLLPGHHLVVFARPEMGKTAFLVNAMAGFARDGRRVLYVANEEPIQATAMRLLSRMTGMPKAEIMADPDTADMVAREHGYENVVLARLSPGTPREIEKLIAQFKPHVLVIDQLRNLNVGEDHFVLKLEKAAMAVRQLGKKHGLVVMSVTQAGDSATGKAILDMGDVDSSNTGIPAQADVMIGIGANAEDERLNRRVLSLPKNKVGGNHGMVPVRFEPLLSKMGDLQ